MSVSESLVNQEIEQLRAASFQENIGSFHKREVGSFFERTLEDFYYGEIDGADMAFFIDLLPPRTIINVYPAHEKILRVDHYDGPDAPVSEYENDWTQRVLSIETDHGDRTQRSSYLAVAEESKTLWLSTGFSGTEGRAVELSFSAYGEPNFRLMIEVVAPRES